MKLSICLCLKQHVVSLNRVYPLPFKWILLWSLLLFLSLTIMVHMTFSPFRVPLENFKKKQKPKIDLTVPHRLNIRTTRSLYTSSEWLLYPTVSLGVELSISFLPCVLSYMFPYFFFDDQWVRRGHEIVSTVFPLYSFSRSTPFFPFQNVDTHRTIPENRTSVTLPSICPFIVSFYTLSS